MTDREFKTWMETSLFVGLPSLAAWMGGVYDAAATQQRWREVLRPYTLPECCSVVDRWVSGELPAPAAYERDLLAASVRAVVDRDRSETRTRANTGAYERPVDDNGNYIPLAPIFARAKKLQEAGVAIEKIYAELEQMLPINGDSRAGPRYACLTCSDSGSVLVWKTRIAVMVDRKQMPLDEADGCFTVACVCSNGDRFAEPKHKYWRPSPRYDPMQYCRYYGDKRDRERLAKWLDDRIEAKKLPEFAAWA